MVSDYVQQLYAPAAVYASRMAADGFRAARELARWRSAVLAAWPGVSVLHVDSQLAGESQLGAMLTLRAEVALNGLSADDVDVEAVFGGVDTEDSLTDIQTVSLKAMEITDGTSRYEGDVPLERTGPFGYTVRVLPKNDLLASPAELGVVATA
jgi:starch phosphorylase